MKLDPAHGRSATVKVAAVHAAPVFLDRTATTEKALGLIKEAAGNGARLVAFPESFIPAFPVWAALWAPIHNHDLFVRMAANSITIDGPEIAALRESARRHEVIVSIGFSEASPYSPGCLWNSFVLIDERGAVVNHHRKLVPTFYEKLIWAPGDGAGLRVVATGAGRVGQLICGENTNPLARYSLMAQGEQIHISSWPAVWPTKPPASGANYDNVAANKTRAAAHSFEAKAFGIVCAGFLDRAMREFLVDRDAAIAGIVDALPRAASLFVTPTGAETGDLLQAEEGIGYAEFDLTECVEPKQFHDVVGYYNRFDVFTLSVSRRRVVPIEFTDEPAEPKAGGPTGGAPGGAAAGEGEHDEGR
ncbi:MAG: carbon-nitrogen hydrolase family protein [Hyphomicrobiales bacterium]